ncbi:MAG: PA2778 family cysteine peptidase, partial [Zoogloea sp.]|nr:PA2778 family cysteine peptidase [Zoogloea sp.]
AVGLATRPEDLTGQVFLPGRKGSLQLEMLAGARRHGAVATVIPGTLEAVMRELAAGHGVVVLQNLGLSWIPAWHYAVVIGYDLDAAHFFLRSGTQERQQLEFGTFENTWARSGFWAFVALPPGQLPATAGEEENTRAALAFEHTAPPNDALLAYAAALTRWPASLPLAIGLGNTLYAAGDKLAAEHVFRKTAERHQDAAAYNNLATVLLDLGRLPEARVAAEKAVALGGPMENTARATLADIEKAGH